MSVASLGRLGCIGLVDFSQGGRVVLFVVVKVVDTLQE